MKVSPMIEIQVRLRPPTGAGRLFSRYDEESRILVAESTVQRPLPFGIDVDGTIVFDIDKASVLATVDVHIARERWKRKQLDALPPQRTVGDLEIAESAIQHKSFNLPLAASCDESGRNLCIELGRLKPDRVVVLSASCSALLASDVLSGFVFKLED